MSLDAKIAPDVQVPEPSEHTLTLSDGTELFYRAWIPAQPTEKALVLVHRGHEHSGRYADVIEALGLGDVAIFAWDARGHGRSPGLRGHAPSFGRVVKDLDEFVRHVCEKHEKRIENTTVLAHSVGAVTAATWVHDYAPPIRGLVLATPALRVKLYVPLAIPGLRVWRKLRGDRPSFVKSYVKAHMLTHDPEQARRYIDDPLIARAIAVNILLDLYDASTRLMADAGAIRVPTLMLTGGADWVVHKSAQRRLFRGLGSTDKQMREFPGMYHDVLHEKDRGEVLGEIRQFLKCIYDAPPMSRRPLLEADRGGYTFEEHDRLTRPLALLSPRRITFGLSRLFMRTAGRLSRGIRIGWQTGFDSGRSLDYVYENRSQGTLGVGRVIDRFYLNSPGWAGIRVRKQNLRRLLSEAITRTRAEGRPVRLLDVATGCGRYVLETLAEAGRVDSVLLRDFTRANLEQGRRIAAEMKLADVKFEQGDAFDFDSLARIMPAPTVAIVSGLYELFPDNERVLRSLRGIAAAMTGGGYLLYTGQPWHPQLEFIARCLSNRDGKPWVMRRRTQEEIDALVSAAGFEKIETAVDDAGIFTVSLARRRHV